MHISSSTPSPRDDALLNLEGLGPVSADDVFSSDRVSTANAALCAPHNDNRGISSKSGSKDILLRLCGICLLGVAAGAFRLLGALMRGGSQAGVTLPDYILALVGILGTCGGAMLLILGRHVLDRVRVSERWQRRN